MFSLPDKMYEIQFLVTSSLGEVHCDKHLRDLIEEIGKLYGEMTVVNHIHNPSLKVFELSEYNFLLLLLLQRIKTVDICSCQPVSSYSKHRIKSLIAFCYDEICILLGVGSVNCSSSIRAPHRKYVLQDYFCYIDGVISLSKKIDQANKTTNYRTISTLLKKQLIKVHSTSTMGRMAKKLLLAEICCNLACLYNMTEVYGELSSPPLYQCIINEWLCEVTMELSTLYSTKQLC